MRPPNILLIVVDQQRYDCIGYSGGRKVSTPNLDRLAAEGVGFEHAYAHIPICSPARQSFMTGRRPESFGAHWNFDLGPRVASLPVTDFSWPRELSAIGYRSAYVGKWHVSPTEDPTAFGYDEYVPEAVYSEFRNKTYPGQELTPGFAGGRDPVPLDHTVTHYMAGLASERIERLSQTGDPWHVRLDFSVPHLPCCPTEAFDSMYHPNSIEPWESFSETFEDKPYIQRQQLASWGIEGYGWEDFAPMVARYFGMVSQIDDAIGRVLRTVDGLSDVDNTIVVYTSDHGDLTGAHRMLDKHYVLYDDVVRVPLIVRWPKRLQAGLRIPQFVYNFLDVPPTLLEWAGVLGLDREWHGESLAGLVNGTLQKPWRTHAISTYHGQQFGLYSQRMIRTEEWKYIWNATDVDELYHVKSDPAELINRIHYPGVDDIVQTLRQALYHELVAQGDRQLDNEWIRRQLLEGQKR